MHTPPLITVVIPCHNEAPHIGGLLRAIDHTFSDIPYACIVVADGCTDRTEAVVEQVMQQNASVSLLHHTERLGKGEAIRRGMLQVESPYAGFIDGDGEIDPTYLRQAWTLLLHSHADVIIGNRYGAGAAYTTTFLRHLTSRIYQRVVWILFGLRFHDTQAGLKVFRTDVARRLFQASNVDGYAFDIDVLVHAHWMNDRIQEFPITQCFKGTSTITCRYTLQMVRDTCRTHQRHVRELLARPRGARLADAISCILAPCTASLGWLLTVVLRQWK